MLKDISATFETGKTNLIIGQSGSGKTVLLKSLVGLHTIDSGVFGLRPGEILIVNMHVTTVQSVSEGLRSTYDIIRVIDHRKPGKHILIPGI